MHESADALASDLLTLITRHPEGLRASELQARAAIAGWDKRMTAESVPAAIYARFTTTPSGKASHGSLGVSSAGDTSIRPASGLK